MSDSSILAEDCMHKARNALSQRARIAELQLQGACVLRDPESLQCAVCTARTHVGAWRCRVYTWPRYSFNHACSCCEDSGYRCGGAGSDTRVISAVSHEYMHLRLPLCSSPSTSVALYYAYLIAAACYSVQVYAC
jgi:hypothetical protein